MASKKQNLNKPELVAIYRLEFYKNKKKWKLSNEKPKEPPKPPKPPKPPCASCVSSKSDRSSKLNKTYCVDSESDLEKEKTSPLNNAFMHVIPTDDPPEDSWEPSPPPPTPQPPDDESNQAAASDASQKDQLSKHAVQTCLQKVHQDMWSSQATLASQQPLLEDQEIYTSNSNKPQIGQNTWPNQEEPVNNLQWLLKSHLDSWNKPPATPKQFHQDSSSNQPLNLGLPSNTWNDQAMPDASQPQLSIWTNQTSNANLGTWNMSESSMGGLQNKCSSDTLATLKPQPQNLYNTRDDHHPTQIPDVPYQVKWNNHIPPPGSQKLHVNQVPSPQEAPYHSDLPLPKSTWLSHGQLTSVKNLHENGPGPVPGLDQVLGPGNPHQMSLQDMTNVPPAFDSDFRNSGRPQKVEDQWGTRKVQDTWSGEAPFELEGLDQDVWTIQTWQEKQELWQNKDWNMAPGTDVPDGLYDVEDSMEYSESQYVPESYDVSSVPAAAVRRRADGWLRRLLQLHRGAGDQSQAECDESAQFIREAHDVPHSSETEPDDTCECVAPSPPAPLWSLPGARLSGAIGHAAATLRHVLGEQLLRDQLRSQNLMKLEEYPTRDTDVFGSDYIMSGSHIPHSTAELTRTKETDRVIKIDMGRPYRL